MRGAVIATLKALYEGKQVTAHRGKQYKTTRMSNEISTLRNELSIDIITDRINTENGKWYGSYRLIRTEENLERVKAILGILSRDDETQKQGD